MPSLKDQINDVLNLVDENLSELNQFKEISHNIDLAFEIVVKRIMKIEKRIEALEDEFLRKGMTNLEAKISRIIREQAADLKNSLIDTTNPLEELKEIAITTRDGFSTRDRDSSTTRKD